MEDTTEVVESISHPHPHDHHLQLGFQAPTFSPPNPDPDSPVSDHDDTQQQQQQQPLHEEFQSLDLKEKEVKHEEISVVEEENVKNDLRSDDDDDHQHVVVVVVDDDDDAKKKSESENENENDGLSYDRVVVDDDDDAKKKSEIENKDGWSDDHGGVVVDEPKKIGSENDGWNDDGWNDYGGVGDGDYEKNKKVENGNNDGWGDHYYPVDDGWKMGENVNKGEESFTALTEEEEEEEDRTRRLQYPLRPDAEDCSFYVRTGSCKFGSNCKFNHPLKKKNQGVKEKVMRAREEYPENPGQIECKYYLRSGGCKFGKACRYNHSRGKTTIAPVLDLNFVGLPIRPGEKECPYYMRTGSCKYSASCRFNHPDPTSGSDPPSGYVNGSSHSLQGVSQPTASSWSSSRTLTETAPYAPIMFPPTQGISSQNSEWNGYQAPAYPPDRHMHPSTPYGMNNSAAETSVYTHHQQQMLVEEFPERPGQPECSYFLKTGDCKYRSNCKFHHPKNRILKSAPCAVTDKGLPLRPDQNICTHYSRYGICKFGPNCRFDHPTNIGNSVSSAVSGPDQTFDRAGFGGNANGSEAVM